MDIQRYQNTLDILHNGFIVCAVLAVMFLMTAVLLFWRFGMVAVIRQRFGIEAKRSIEEFKEQNESTGALKYHSAALGERTPRAQLKPEDAPAAQAVGHTSLGAASPSTAKQITDEVAPLTTRLDSNLAIAAEVLIGAQEDRARESVQIVGFEVTKNVLLIEASRDALIS
jgi:hypothetical protein